MLSSYKTIQVKRESRTAAQITVSADPYKGICFLKKVVLQGNDDALESPLCTVPGLFPDVIGYPGNIAGIQGSIYLI